MFRATLFRIVKTWMQDKCPSTDERVTDRQEYHPTIKKKEIMPSVATWMDLEVIILNEVSQTEYHMTSHINICGI